MVNESIEDLLEILYEAIANTDRWQDFLDHFVAAVGGRTGTLFMLAPEHEQPVLRWTGVSQEDVHLYMSKYAANDPWRIRAATVPEGMVVCDYDFCPRDEMEASAAFREYYSRVDAVHGIGIPALVTRLGSAGLTATRGLAAGPFGESEKAFVRRLYPHIRRAFALHCEMAAVRSQLGIFTQQLDGYPHPFVLTDRECAILYANAAARAISASRDGVSLESGRLSVKGQQNATLQHAVRDMTDGRGRDLHRLVVSRISGRNPYRLLVMRVAESGGLPLGFSKPAAAVLIIDTDPARTGPDAAVIQEVFSLTPAEARVAGKLARGHSVEEIAAESGAAVETVRSHLKR